MRPLLDLETKLTQLLLEIFGVADGFVALLSELSGLVFGVLDDFLGHVGGFFQLFLELHLLDGQVRDRLQKIVKNLLKRSRKLRGQGLRACISPEPVVYLDRSDRGTWSGFQKCT